MQAEFRRCMLELDVPQARRLWAHVFAHLPQPKTDSDMLLILHRARTEAESMPLEARTYSHHYLLERGYPSGLPSAMRDKIQEGVGVSINASSPMFKPIVPLVERAVNDAILDAYAEGDMDPVFVKSRIRDVRKDTVRKLLGV